MNKGNESHSVTGPVGATTSEGQGRESILESLSREKNDYFSFLPRGKRLEYHSNRGKRKVEGGERDLGRAGEGYF